MGIGIWFGALHGIERHAAIAASGILYQLDHQVTVFIDRTEKLAAGSMPNSRDVPGSGALENASVLKTFSCQHIQIVHWPHWSLLEHPRTDHGSQTLSLPVSTMSRYPEYQEDVSRQILRHMAPNDASCVASAPFQCWEEFGTLIGEIGSVLSGSKNWLLKQPSASILGPIG
ncbi:MAG: hypothetical protein IPP33_18050 [Flavobacteriales bacterium]|nr:hypothetical protein [Flavobacteriales bacterium]